MKTLNICATTFFILVFLLTLIGAQDLPLATVIAFVVSVPLYLMGCFGGLCVILRGDEQKRISIALRNFTHFS